MSEYTEIADRQWEKIDKLTEERERIDRDLKNARELLKAAVNAMSDEEKGPYIASLTDVAIEQHGLTYTIRLVLQGEYRFFTPVQVKERMEQIGYDFSAYKSNPLSSIHSVLKRFKRTEVDTLNLKDGGTAYRWRVKKARKSNRSVPIDALAGLADARPPQKK